MCETRNSKYNKLFVGEVNFKIYSQFFKQAIEQRNMEVSNLFFSKCNINQCLKVLFIFCIQMAIRTRLVSKSHSMFGFAICICCDTFCFWLVPVVWRSVKLIKFWQQDKSCKPLWHFLLCLLWWYLYSSGSNQLSLGDHCIIAINLSISNDTRGKFSYKSWQLFITQTSEDDLSFETDGEQPG